MADVNCPMCGKPNPPELDNCQFCDARLKPLITSGPREDLGDPFSGGPPPSQGVPTPQEPEDWLSELRSGDVSPTDDAEDSAEPYRGEREEPAESGQEDDSGTPDWLGRLRDGDDWQTEAEEDDLLGQEPGEGEYLSRLSDWSAEESAPREEGEPYEAVEPDESVEPDLPFQLPVEPGESRQDWLPEEPSPVTPEEGQRFDQPIVEGMDDLPEEAFETKEFPELSMEAYDSGDEPQEDQTPKWMQSLAQEPPGETEPQPQDRSEFPPIDVGAGERDDRESLDWSLEPLTESGREEPQEAGEMPVFPWEEEGARPPGVEAEPDEIPEWLQSSRFDRDFFADQEADAEEGEPEAEGLPDWLQSAQLESAFLEKDAGEEDEGPGWEPEGFDEEPEEAEIPDWLQSARFEDDFLDAETVDEGVAFPGQEEETIDLAGEGEVPDWLESAELETALREPSQTKDLPELAEEGDYEVEIPADETAYEWLAEEEVGLPEDVDEGAGEPAWMAPGDPEAESTVSLEEGDVPDWLRNLQAVQEEAISEAEEEAFTEFEAAVGELAEEGEGERPTWLADMQPVTPELAEEIDEDLPVPGAEPGMPELEAGEPEPAMPGDLPGWISEISIEESVEPGTLEPVEDEIELTPAELPGWLKAMRPVEAVAPATPQADKPDEGLESAGPLAGMQGILPAEAEILQAGKPPTFTTKVGVTENQYSHINLLKSILSVEAEPQTRKAKRVVQPQRILRWLIAAGLILAILFPLVLGSQASPLPSLFPPETLAVGEIINQLPSGAPVLVSFDYQPALSGELEAAAMPVVDHLMIRGTGLALVSTSPAGPALAERFLEAPDGLGDHGYAHGEQYVNLGFLSGGAAGLLDFVTSPRGTLPEPFTRRGLSDGQDAWSAPPLQGVQSIRDFALVLVIVDDADTARNWVEQVGPRLGDVPLAMVISAQAEPLVRPFYESIPRQVNGMVTGLSGGASYGQIISRSHLARNYWDAFSNGLLMAELLILVGGAYNVFMALFMRREPIQVEGKA